MDMIYLMLERIGPSIARLHHEEQSWKRFGAASARQKKHVKKVEPPFKRGPPMFDRFKQQRLLDGLDRLTSHFEEYSMSTITNSSDRSTYNQINDMKHVEKNNEAMDAANLEMKNNKKGRDNILNSI
ncbi:hypothetical protein [Pseudoduganella namucuonensis]|nr:hypothetical protein [Pseudoduganella namucuonensis]